MRLHTNFSRLFFALILSSSLTGCVGYTTYPPPGEGTGDVAFNSPNTAPAPDVIFTAVKYAVEQYPVDGEYTINLPAELNPTNIEYIGRVLGDPRAVRLTPETESLPVYHISRVWIRGFFAEVDVFRPVLDIPGPEGAPVHQRITLKLRAHFARWRVQSAQASVIGIADPPSLTYREPVPATAVAAPVRND